MLKKVNSLSLLSRREYKNLLVSTEVFRQQEKMQREWALAIAERIVSVSQPHNTTDWERKNLCGSRFWSEDLGIEGRWLCVSGDTKGECVSCR